MNHLTYIVLDVLKPHSPTILALADAIAGSGPGYEVGIDVEAVDEKTENVIVTVRAAAIDYDRVSEAISALGGSVHSIDEVHVRSDS